MPQNGPEQQHNSHRQRDHHEQDQGKLQAGGIIHCGVEAAVGYDIAGQSSGVRNIGHRFFGHSHSDGEPGVGLGDRHIAVAGQVPLVLLPVVAVAVNVYFLAVLLNGDGLPVKIEQEVVSLRQSVGGEAVGVGGHRLTVFGYLVEQILIAQLVMFLPVRVGKAVKPL